MTSALSLAARREFAAGWPAVIAAAVAICVGMTGIGFYSLGLFVKPLQDEFGWSRAAVSGAATFEQFGIFLSAPIVGKLADRFGVKPIAIASYVATPLAFVALSRAGPSIWSWYALWLLVSLAGCGTTPAIWARAIATRFDAGRGLALGLMLLGTGVAAILAPAILGPVIVAYGWRTAVLAMGAAVLVIGLPVSLAMARDEPLADEGRSAPRGNFEVNRATLVLVAVAIALGAIVAGLIVHLVPLLVDRGLDPAEAAGMAAGLGLAVVLSRVIVGFLFDRFHAPYVAAFFLASPAIACVVLLSGGPVFLAALLLGVAAGAEVDMLAYLTGRYAAMRNYGATYGLILGLFSFGAGCGPPAFGWSVDLTGNYQFVLVLSGLALTVVVVAIATLGPYRTQVARD
ncbi:MFS transporter [Novosphingobium sp. PC22D]|uniref:MFS transporter n=1 Tax=Novosphingobium sp. PC22D TaxID=1962403 RepID=UPI000BF00656|nr:MFS transporter [Novosphingobium sp. PC22D]PEQ11348.1 MFS transporter [Novosphingobium sp. PC22D]